MAVPIRTIKFWRKTKYQVSRQPQSIKLNLDGNMYMAEPSGEIISTHTLIRLEMGMLFKGQRNTIRFSLITELLS